MHRCGLIGIFRELHVAHLSCLVIVIKACLREIRATLDLAQVAECNESFRAGVIILPSMYGLGVTTGNFAPTWALLPEKLPAGWPLKKMETFAPVEFYDLTQDDAPATQIPEVIDLVSDDEEPPRKKPRPFIERWANYLKRHNVILAIAHSIAGHTRRLRLQRTRPRGRGPPPQTSSFRN
eukprot:COSAG02_NODE_5024_length_4719_cov_13.040693_1_plen_180_part_00